MSSGFHLALSDMVLEMKRNHIILQHRYFEPSLAGMFMGANALLCKPMESFLPVIAASVLGRHFGGADHGSGMTTNEILASTRDDDHIVAAADASAGGIAGFGDGAGSDELRQILFRLLILPPLFFSVVQYYSWSRYTLTPNQVHRMREELRLAELQQQQRH